MEEKEGIFIQKVGNGYVIYETTLYEINDKGVKIFHTDVEVLEEDDGDEKLCLTILLEKVAEMCGYSYDKFGKENLKITFDKIGHKVE
jgi:hypothetical protein